MLVSKTHAAKCDAYVVTGVSSSSSLQHLRFSKHLQKKKCVCSHVVFRSIPQPALGLDSPTFLSTPSCGVFDMSQIAKSISSWLKLWAL